MNVLSDQAMSSGIYQCINNDEKPVFRRPSKSQPHWVEIHSKGELSFSFTFDSMVVCFNLLILNLSPRIRDECDVLSLPFEGGLGTPQIKTIAPVKRQFISKGLFGIFNSPKKFDFTTRVRP